MTCKSARTLSIYSPDYVEAARDRLVSKVVGWGDPGCWFFKGAKDAQGYGKISLLNFNGYGFVRAHVLSYMLEKGDIPAEMDVCHSCNEQSCVNPYHLYVGTRSENVQHAVRDGLSRHWGKGARLTDDQVRELKQRYAAGGASQRAIAEEFGVDQQIVSRIVRGEAYKWVNSY